MKCVCGVVFIGVLAACTPESPEPPAALEVEYSGERTPWTSLELLDDPDRFHFAIVTDRTGGHRAGVFPLGLDKLNLLQPEFVVSVGDLIEGYSVSRNVLDEEWGEFEGFLTRLEMPFFYTPGNHDMSNPVMLRVWEERFGPSFYHFGYRGVLFIVLNSELFFTQTMEQPERQLEQLAWLERVLLESADARWTMVFLHQPFWEYEQLLPGSGGVPDWKRVEQLLGDRPHTVVAGHLHRFNRSAPHGHDRITLATTGGFSYLRGLRYGEFDHVAWVTMTEDGPRIANLMLEGVQGIDLDVSARLRAGEIGRALQSAVTLEPLVAAADPFDGGAVAFSIRNPTEAPVLVTAEFEASPNLTPSPARIEAELAPGEERRFAVELAAVEAVARGELAPVQATWELRTELPDGVPLSQELEFALAPEGPLDLLTAPDGVEVDGDLSEWGELPLSAHEPGDGGDSLRFAVAHDQDFLYVAARVSDDELFVPAEGYPPHQDALGLMVDARPTEQREATLSFNAAVLTGQVGPIIVLTASPPAGDGGEPAIWGRDQLPEGTRIALRRADGGYTAEVAIPAAALDERQGAPWETLRLSVGAYDADDGGRDRLQYSWRPSRLSAQGRPGLDTFVRR